MKRSTSCALALFALLSCAAPQKISLSDLASVAHLSSLPIGAEVEEGGQPLGRTPLDLPLQAGRIYQLTFALPDFEPQTVSGDRALFLGERGGRIAVVLLPPGFAPPGRLSFDDAAGLAALAQRLERGKDWGHAAEVWARILVLAPRDARAHRGMGSALAKLGQDEAAIQQYEQYVFLAPDAPDAPRVQRAIDAYRGGIDLPSGVDP